MNVHLCELLERLEKLGNRARRAWGKAGFGITWKNNYLCAGTGPFFEADILQGIAQWDAELFQDIYYIEQGVDEAESGEELRRVSKDELCRILNDDR